MSLPSRAETPYLSSSSSSVSPSDTPPQATMIVAKVFASLMTVALAASASSQVNHHHQSNKGGSNKETERVLQSTIADFWKIEEPDTEYSDSVLQLHHFFNDLVNDSMIVWTFWDRNCKEGGVELTSSGIGYELDVENDPSPNGDGTGKRRNTLSFKPTPAIKDNDVVYTGDLRDGGDREASVEMCARVSLKTNNGIEVNFLEHVLKIRFVFTDEFILIQTVTVAPPLVDLTKVELGVQLRAYDCSDASGGVLTQGMVIRVCIEPVPQAVRDGFRMKAIEWFEYSKIDPNVTQVAVLDRFEAANDLTRLICDQGSTQCSVETMLIGPFYSGTGTVEAHGLATMQLGDHSSDRRRLSGGNYETNLRGLQEALPETVEQEFDLPLEVITSSQDSQDATTNMSWLADSEIGSKQVSIWILILLVLDILTILVLIFQLPFFKGRWFFLS